MALTDGELERYARQLVLPEFGAEAQERLRGAGALVVGAGALGCAAAGYLAAAGVGRLGIADPDRVDVSNLQRQLLHFTPDVGSSKAESAASKLGLLNPEVVVEPYPARLEEGNAPALIAGMDLVLDCTDNLPSRYTLNDACVRSGVPLVSGGVLGFAGQVMTVLPGESACYRCAFPEPADASAAPGCREAGIVGPLAGIVGSAQALEAIKLLTGLGEPLADRILQVEGLEPAFTVVATSRRESCEACGVAVAAGPSNGRAA